MKLYSYHGVNDFIVCLGYKGFMIKEYFANYFLHMSDVTFDMANNKMEIHEANAEPWRVTLVDTGENVMTGGRMKRVASYIGEDNFCFTYGDGVADVNIKELIKFHKTQGTLATVTSVQPPGRFGELDITHGKITAFKEKPQGDGASISGGFFILSPRVLDYIKNDNTVWEKEPLEKLANEGQLSAYQHNGFWQPMDTLRDKVMLDELWASGKAPWKVWK
jgi:glucose-1-phosphate cytidylyltransferase